MGGGFGRLWGGGRRVEDLVRGECNQLINSSIHSFIDNSILEKSYAYLADSTYRR